MQTSSAFSTPAHGHLWNNVAVLWIYMSSSISFKPLPSLCIRSPVICANPYRRPTHLMSDDPLVRGGSLPTRASQFLGGPVTECCLNSRITPLTLGNVTRIRGRGMLGEAQPLANARPSQAQKPTHQS